MGQIMRGMKKQELQRIVNRLTGVFHNNVEIEGVVWEGDEPPPLSKISVASPTISYASHKFTFNISEENCRHLIVGDVVEIVYPSFGYHEVAKIRIISIKCNERV